MIPYGTTRVLERFPTATAVLIAVNVAVFVVQLAAGWDLADNPLLSGPWAPLTNNFCHAGVKHLIFNMLFLWVFGPHAEDVLGPGRFLAVYFLSAAGAQLLQAIADFVSLGYVQTSLGASGAVMGIVALFVVRFPHVRVRVAYGSPWVCYATWEVEARWVALFYVALDVVFGLIALLTRTPGGVGHWAHLGGFAVGSAMAVAMHLPEEAAEDAEVEEVRRLAASGTYDLAAARAIEAANRFPNDARLQELAAAQCAVSIKFADRAVEFRVRALRIYLADGADARAIEAYEKIAATAGHDAVPPHLRMVVAEALVRAGRCADAVEVLRSVVDGPADTALRADAGLRAAHIAAGLLKRPRLARQYLEYVARAFPDTRQAMEARDLLGRLC